MSEPTSHPGQRFSLTPSQASAVEEGGSIGGGHSCWTVLSHQPWNFPLGKFSMAPCSFIQTVIFKSWKLAIISQLDFPARGRTGVSGI